jgi:hypothetical protein
VSRSVTLSCIGELRFYQSTHIQAAGHQLFGIGIEPAFRVSDELSIPVVLRYETGELQDGTGLTQASAGLGVRLKF